MRRLVYAPSVEAYIRSEEAGVVYDVSKDIINGNVSRRLDAVSNATLTLQNKFGKYTRKIRPMDRIIIFLTRMGKPTLAFTGYVDTAPFYQLTPRPITITASCTLKLIQNTYFDPGLPFMSQWFQRYGWTWNSSTGELIDPFQQGFGNFDQGFIKEDGNVARLIAGALVDIGGWPEDHIWVRTIPKSFINSMTSLMNKEAAQSKNELNELMIRMERLFGVGIAEVTGSDGGEDGDVTYSGNITMEQVAEVAYKAGFRGDALITAVAITQPESRLNTKAHNPVPPDDSYGLWQINMIGDLGPARRAEYGIATNEELWNPSVNARAAWAISGKGANNFRPWTTFVAGAHEAHMGAAEIAVNKYLARRAGGPAYDPRGDKPADGTATQWAGKSDASKPNSQNKAKFLFPIAGPKEGIYLPANGSGGAFHADRPNGRLHAGNDIAGPIGRRLVACVDGEIIYSSDASGGGLTIGLYSPAHDETYTYMHCDTITVRNGQKVVQGEPIGTLGNTGINSTGPHLHFQIIAGKSPFANPQSSAGGARNPNSELTKSYQSGNLMADLGGGGGVVGGDSGSGSDSDDKRTAAIARQAAWFTMTLPTVDTLTSMLLTGKRAIQNDITLFDWIQSMVTASGRRFMSMPNGDFISFFPDYFSLHGRTPYYVIRDIEIMDLTIDVSDRDLKTHVFVTGTSYTPTLSLIDRLQSMFASVQENSFNVFINTNVDADGKKKKVATFEPNEFLQRYGVRPTTVDLPEIRHPSLLWMAAWTEFSKMWANNFQSQASFTFLPELLPGGVVEFENKITMFVEEVTHSFDMESGFTTSATLSAPASATNSSAFGSMVMANNFGIAKLIKEDEEIQRTIEKTRDPQSPIKISGGARGGV